MPRAPQHVPSSRPAATPYRPLVVTLVAVAAGITVDRLAGFSAPAWWSAAAAAWLAWFALWRLDRQRLAAAALLLALAAAGGAWHHCRWSLFATDDVGFFARDFAEPACVEVIAAGGPRRIPSRDGQPAFLAGDQTRLDVRVTAIRDGDAWRGASGRATILVRGDLLDIAPGDRLLVFAQLAAPEPPRNPGQFDYAAHLQADRLRGLLRVKYPDCVSVAARASRLRPARVLDSLRAGCEALLDRHLSPEYSGLAAALLLSVRERIEIERGPDELAEGEPGEGDPEERPAEATPRTAALMETGTIHLISVSGLHVAILAAFLMLPMRWGLLPRKPALAAIAILTVLYTLLADAEPPAVRAMIMVLIVCGALYLGRQPLAFNTLAAAALVVLALNPADLFRVGPQLSFLGVAAIAWIASFRLPKQLPDPLDRLIAQTRPWPVRAARWLAGWFWHATVAGAAVWLIMSPLVMARFHLLSPAAIVLTPLLAVPVALALCSGFGVFSIGWLFPPAGFVLGWICDQNLWILDRLIHVARSVPGNHFWVLGPSGWWLAGFYAGLAVLAAFPAIRPPRRWCVAILAGWSAVGLLTPWLRTTEEARLDCTFLSVGHGSAVVLELPGGETILYDAGRLGSPETAAESIAGFLWARGRTHLDAVVVSHADADHCNAMPALLERFSVGVIYVSPPMLEHEGAEVRQLLAQIRAAGVPVRPLWSGDRLRTGGTCRIEVLHPPRRGLVASDNANSLVLAVEYAGKRILLPGDLEPPGLDYLTAEEPYDCEVLLAPHHGSRQSSPPGFAAWSKPDWVIVSGSFRQNAEAVVASYREGGSRVLHTAIDGAVRVTIDRIGSHVAAWRNRP
ncbi:MAG: ComEC/Rec2 family competence protein [Pirellulales bacterium]